METEADLSAHLKNNVRVAASDITNGKVYATFDANPQQTHQVVHQRCATIALLCSWRPCHFFISFISLLFYTQKKKCLFSFLSKIKKSCKNFILIEITDKEGIRLNSFLLGPTWFLFVQRNFFGIFRGVLEVWTKRRVWWEGGSRGGECGVISEEGDRQKRYPVGK